jgi:hypothetical protein
MDLISYIFKMLHLFQNIFNLPFGVSRRAVRVADL